MFIGIMWAQEAVALFREFVHTLHHVAYAHGIGDLDLAAGRQVRGVRRLAHFVFEEHLLGGCADGVREVDDPHGPAAFLEERRKFGTLGGIQGSVWGEAVLVVSGMGCLLE